MTRIFRTILCCLVVLFLTADAAKATYDARADTNFQLRQEADVSSRKMGKVLSGAEVTVLEYGQWCKILVGGREGYCRAEWLWQFRTQDVSCMPIPGAVIEKGVAAVMEDFHASVDGYAGNAFTAGTMFAVTDWDDEKAYFPMMRSATEADAKNLAISPIVPVSAAKPDEIIAAFTTYYNGESGGKLAAERAYNIILACERVSGARVEKGESFSFNALCAPYLKSNGYQKAPNVSNDGVGYGGGVCQVSTTLYNALLALPLRITAWNVHNSKGVVYIPRGFDSAVGGYTDLCFVNDLDYPIEIFAFPQEGVVTVLIVRASTFVVETQ